MGDIQIVVNIFSTAMIAFLTWRLMTAETMIGDLYTEIKELKDNK